ncbi:L,D-transpeptidase family protein [Bisgaard Taxon 10/6]|uniref:L,D-transpeptidase family protein n=1 Tax=Exercitatus varius TaxID=67857 RepID=UPI00294B878B|nr:L,D-transpeptidase family protein [Exercitatus varius]MDG2960642.1 L,D-transpeptidase family protein [Exercitatus varius]
MAQSKRSFKFAPLVVLISGLCTSCVLSDYFPNTSNRENIDVDLATQQVEQQKREEAERLEAARKAEEERLAQEKQRQAEEKLVSIVGDRPLQFKSAVAKIYADREYEQIWTDSAAEKQFLREYAAMVASGISARSAHSLDLVAGETDKQIYDILLTDAFLDYLYYSENVTQSAQSWLYSVNGYHAGTPTDEDIALWLEAVKNNGNLNFINGLHANNSLYQQTLNHIAANLNAVKKESANNNYKLAINAQRLRIIPDFYNGIFVNIPSYQLNYYRNGRLTLNSRVIVGKNERRTPVMYSKLSNVVVNPPWNAPTRLINEDIIPKVKRDPGYLARHGYSIIDSRGNTVNPYDINWAAIGNKFPYRLRQAAGDNSALGRYKFNMPSSDAIYLHDTPNHALFDSKNRALSSGCVRVDKSDQLASILLSEAGWSSDKKQRVLDSKKTTSALIQSDNPVYLYYVTTWVENGKVQSLPDIYGYDRVGHPDYVNWNTIQKYL